NNVSKENIEVEEVIKELGSSKEKIDISVENDCNRGDQVKNDKNSDEWNKKESYAKKVTNNLKANKNELFTVPTGLNKDGEEVVVFDEELVKEE
ncbi:hypothetical protein Tco_0579723, partial [Tanacetum coccineum]